MENYIIENSGKLTESVSKNTTLLIHVKGETESSKYKKAKELNIPIMTHEEFKKKYMT